MPAHWRESARLNPKPQNEMFVVYGIGFPGADHAGGLVFERDYTTEISAARKQAHDWALSQQYDIVTVYRIELDKVDGDDIVWKQVGGPILVLQSP
jgi:hypothetical protein